MSSAVTSDPMNDQRDGRASFPVASGHSPLLAIATRCLSCAFMLLAVSLMPMVPKPPLAADGVAKRLPRRCHCVSNLFPSIG